MTDIIQNWLTESGLSQNYIELVSILLVGLIVIIAAWVANFIANRILLTVITYVIKKSKTEFDDYLVERKVFNRLAHIAPAIVFYLTADSFGEASSIIQKLSVLYMAIAGLGAIYSFINALTDMYNRFDISKERPIKGYTQLVKIILAVAAGIVLLAMIMDKNPVYLLSGLGAMTAVLLFVFKDSILGLIASIQLTTNKMVKVGDWIEMPKYGADGDVIDMSLHTIKVQNWDKTITTIPTYSLISDSFKNWRGMSESGGRRIKRSVFIDMNSIKFLDEDLLKRLDKIQLLNEYLKRKREEIDKDNTEKKVDRSVLANGRNLTNIGTFRGYLEAYLRNHPKIHQKLTFIVRQLQPSEKGLPIEIYVFSSDQDWVRYEGIQSDIFDHILAVLPIFDLRVYQYPTGSDLTNLIKQ